jgi:hypothetical protein
MLGCIYSSYTQMTTTHADGGGGRSTCAPAAAEADEPDGVSTAATVAWAACGRGGRPETTGPAGRPAGRQPDRQTCTSFDGIDKFSRFPTCMMLVCGPIRLVRPSAVIIDHKK